MTSEQILTNPQALKQILLYLYQFQTPQEQSTEQTIEQNGSGFNHVDAEILSSFAQQVLKGYELSPKQITILKLRLPKYHGQYANGAWQQINLPELISTRKEPVTSAGSLLVEMVGGKPGLKFKPNVYPSQQIKSVGFTHWKDGAWHQSAPSINPTAVEDVKRLFGDTVFVDFEVAKLLVKEPARIPSWLTEHPTLFPYQKDAIQFMLTHKRALLALAPGLGKTACSILAAKAAGCKRILIVSPLSLLYTWKAQVKQWTGEEAVIVYKKQLPVAATYTITNYDTLRLHLNTFVEGDWDAIIVDESLLIKNRKAKRTDSIRKLVTEAKCEYVWLLSGAPVSKFYTDMWAQLNVLNPDRFTSFWRWAERYVQIESNQWSKYNIVANKPDAPDRILKDHADMYFARSQADSGLNIPDWIFDENYIPLSPAQDKLYASMEETFLAELSEDESIMAPNVLTQLLRLVQFASNPVLVGGKEISTKWDACEELLEFEQGPFIIWTNFIETATRFTERLHLKGKRVAKLTGATPMDQRQQIVDDFQNGMLDVILAHPAVGKFGLTLTRARTAIYLERGYNADDYFQSLHRIKRIGTTQSPHVIHLIATRAEGGNTVDHVIHKILAGRKDMVDKITNMNLKQLFMEKE